MILSQRANWWRRNVAMSRKRPYWHRPRYAVKCAREGPFAPFGSITVMATLAPARDFAGAFLLSRKELLHSKFRLREKITKRSIQFCNNSAIDQDVLPRRALAEARRISRGSSRWLSCVWAFLARSCWSGQCACRLRPPMPILTTGIFRAVPFLVRERLPLTAPTS